MSTTRRTILAGASALLATSALGQPAWPERGKPITIIVPYAPGGSTDTSARMMAASIEQEIPGSSVVVLNRPGGGAQIGMTELARARPDGYTLVWCVLPTVITHYLDPSRRATYTRASFQTVGLHHFSPVTFAVRADSPYRSMRDLVEAARANPEGIAISDSGLMATPHTGVLLLQSKAGVRFTSVHFNAGPPSATALLGGHVQAVAGGASDVMTGWRSGDFRVLGTAFETPDPLLPGVPTLKEQGYDVIMASASGVLAPAGTPMPIVQRLSEAMRRTIEKRDYRDRLWQFGIVPTYLTAEDYAAYWERDEARMRPIMAAVQTE